MLNGVQCWACVLGIADLPGEQIGPGAVRRQEVWGQIETNTLGSPSQDARAKTQDGRIVERAREQASACQIAHEIQYGLLVCVGLGLSPLTRANGDRRPGRQPGSTEK
jgi:hypothetical protein